MIRDFSGYFCRAIVMTFEDKVNSLIGKPYEAYKAHCWTLVEDLLDNAPRIKGTAETLTKSVKHFKKELLSHNLKEVDIYQDKDIIILGKNNTFFHAGVFYKGGIIHASESGVVYQSLFEMKKIYTEIKGLRV